MEKELDQKKESPTLCQKQNRKRKAARENDKVKFVSARSGAATRPP
jgi:hypothetical protein